MPGSPLVGMTLPTFTADGGAAVAAARQAAEGGLDGVFAFDHLWPMGAPGRPALWSFAVLAAAAAVTERIRIGTWVARVGLLPDDVLVRTFASLAGIAGPGRLIAAIGVGDHLSADENRAYGLTVDSASGRLDAAGRVLDALRHLEVESWMGARSASSVATAVAHADAVNTWGTSAREVGELAGENAVVTWGGQVLVGRDHDDVTRLTERYGDRPALLRGTVEEVARELAVLADAGASWVVLAPLDYLAETERCVETVCRLAEAVR